MSVRKQLASLRHRMKQRNLAAYLVPSADPHLSEYPPERWKRREYLSGFTGSAGDLVVTPKVAGLWTDGRYFLQAERELSGSGIQLFRSGEEGVDSIESFLRKNVRKGKSLGCDPRLLSEERAESLEEALAEVGAQLRLIDENLVDLVWSEQPDFPTEPAELLPRRFSGRTTSMKLRDIRGAMRERGADLLVVTSLDAVAWLFNLRGGDVPYNPVVIAYALVTQKGAALFVPPGKIPTQLRAKLGREVSVHQYDGFGAALRKRSNPNVVAWVDPESATRWVFDNLRSSTILREMSPISLRKARKNPQEIAGTRIAHERDGVAMVRFLHWLHKNVGKGDVTEISAADKLEEFRAQGDNFQGLSFHTISAFGPNGAIIHYRSTEETNAKLGKKGIYLVDSGAQYLDGTTDITRTVLLGRTSTKKQREHFTRVLKGHIALARARFPRGVRGMRLDTLARVPLWEKGLDYSHGTGHGVGSYLNVHEGPQSISPGRCNGAALEPGNVQSNEPGLYLPGEYGIRIENLILVVEDSQKGANGDGFLSFETLTLCPIDRRLIDVKLLTPEERKWLNDYHARVKKTLSPELNREEKAWLKAACAKI